MKKYLLSLLVIFAAAFGISSNASALRHDYLTIPAFESQYLFATSSFPTSSFNTQPFSISWSSSNNQNAPVPVRQLVLYSNYNSSSDSCVYNRWAYFPSQTQGYSLGFYYNFPAVVYNTSTISTCNYLAPFGSPLSQPDFNLSSVPAFDENTLPNLPLTPEIFLVRSHLPYRYDYDHIELKSSAISSNGVVYNKSLKASDLYSGDFIPNKFARLSIPFDRWNESVGGALTAGRSIEFRGTFSFPGLSSQSDFAFAPNFTTGGVFQFNYTYLNPNTGVYTGGDISCSLTRTYAQALDSSLSMNLDYSCPFEVPQDFSGGYFEYYLVIQASSSDGYIWDTTSDWGWAGSYVITDNDSTLGSPMSESCEGSNCSYNPGSAQPLADEAGDGGDFFSSFVNLFRFNLLNPFQGIYDLFTPHQNCVDISTLASMIHSSQTVYCSWWSSSVVNIVTPVFALSSTMLLFGFFVSWLRSDAGDGSIDNGGTSIKVKGSKK